MADGGANAIAMGEWFMWLARLLYADAFAEVKPIFFSHSGWISTPRFSPGPSVALQPASIAHSQHAPAASALRWAAVWTFHHARLSREFMECLPAWILSPLGDRGNAVRF
jgi:hypothetical protein